MAQLENFKDLESKKNYFSNNRFYTIDTKTQFDDWFDIYSQDNKVGERINYMYRGMTEASYRLYTSAQRQWIRNDMAEWVTKGYFFYVQQLVNNAKQDHLIKKVFDLYGYNDEQRELPILSILQHYGAPTPLMDWTYNINVALFFATQNVNTGVGIGPIEKYFSIYFVNKFKTQNVFKNIFQVQHKKQPSLEDIDLYQTDKENQILLYLSDFEVGSYRKKYQKFTINARMPITSIYNQNIIPQEGLFILNPFANEPIDHYLHDGKYDESMDFQHPFACFNIKKDLADYVRRRIKNRANIEPSFIYPDLKSQVEGIHEETLYRLAR